MESNLAVVIFVSGVVLIILGLIGKIEWKEIKLNTTNRIVRIVFVVIGAVFIIYVLVQVNLCGEKTLNDQLSINKQENSQSTEKLVNNPIGTDVTENKNKENIPVQRKNFSNETSKHNNYAKNQGDPDFSEASDSKKYKEETENEMEPIYTSNNEYTISFKSSTVRDIRISEVYVDGNYVGIFHKIESIRLAEGKHTIRLENKDRRLEFEIKIDDLKDNIEIIIPDLGNWSKVDD